MGALISRQDAELLTALDTRNESRLRQALREGGDPNYACAEGPILPSFLRRGSAARDDFAGKAVALLTRAGADVEALAASGMGSVHAAAWHSDEGAILALLAAGANPRSRSATGCDPLHYLGGAFAPRAGSGPIPQTEAIRAGEAGARCALALLEAGSDSRAQSNLGLSATALIRGRGGADLAAMIEAWVEARELAGSSGEAQRADRGRKGL